MSGSGESITRLTDPTFESCRDQGAQAFEDGYGIKDNPYSFNDDLDNFYIWRSGFVKADSGTEPQELEPTLKFGLGRPQGSASVVGCTSFENKPAGFDRNEPKVMSRLEFLRHLEIFKGVGGKVMLSLSTIRQDCGLSKDKFNQYLRESENEIALQTHGNGNEGFLHFKSSGPA